MLITKVFQGQEVTICGSTDEPLYRLCDIGKAIGIAKADIVTQNYTSRERLMHHYKTSQEVKCDIFLSNEGLEKLCKNSNSVVGRDFLLWTKDILFEYLKNENETMKEIIHKSRLPNKKGIFILINYPYAKTVKIGIAHMCVIQNYKNNNFGKVLHFVDLPRGIKYDTVYKFLTLMFPETQMNEDERDDENDGFFGDLEGFFVENIDEEDARLRLEAVSIMIEMVYDCDGFHRLNVLKSFVLEYNCEKEVTSAEEKLKSLEHEFAEKVKNSDSNPVCRIITQNQEPYSLYCAMDIAKICGITNIRSITSNYCSSMKQIKKVKTKNGEQECTFLTYKGLVKFLQGTRKEAAIEFMKKIEIDVHDMKFPALETSVIEKIKQVFDSEKTVSQHVVGDYKVDLYFPEYKIAVEVDENYHLYQKEEDKIREDFIKKEMHCEFVRINYKDNLLSKIGDIYKLIRASISIA